MPKTTDTRGARTKEAASLYSPLDLRAHEIRLLTIMPLRKGQDKDSPICCSMQTYQLHKTNYLTYAAVSYVWGDPDDTVEVRINDHPLKITRNLLELLKVLRTSYRVSMSRGNDPKPVLPPIWADAICIDQSNLEERTHQVALMQNIYRLASQVVVWLGQPAQNPPAFLQQTRAWKAFKPSDGGLKIVWRGGCYPDRCFREFPFHESPCQETYLRIKSCDLNIGLKSLLESAWWSRLWVIQEVALCLDVIAFWGRNQFDFQPLQRWLQHVVIHLIEKKFRPAEIWILWDRTGFTPEYLFEKRRALEIVRFGLREELTKLATHEMLDCLSTISERRTLDPRDHVYGFLSLFPHNLNIQPDYASCLANVFQAGALGLMKFMRSPALIMMAGQQLRTESELASWIPDFRLLREFPQLSGHADGQRTLPARAVPWHNVGRRLAVHALVIDEVTWTSPCMPRFLLEDHPETEHSIELKTALRNCLSTRAAGRHEAYGLKNATAICATVMAPASSQHNRIPRSKNKTCYIDQYAVDAETTILLVEWLQRKGHLTREGGNIEVRKVWDLATTLSEQVLFTTKHERVGKVLLSRPEKGDLVVIVSGVSLPLIIRPRPEHGPQVYELVRTCLYCHGVMYGEAIREAALKKNGDDTNLEGVYQEIQLV